MAGERTEKPSPKRLADAKKKGQVAKSPEINSTLVLLGTFATIAIAAPAMWQQLRQTFHDTIVRTSNPEVDAETIGGLMTGWGSTVAHLCLPLFGVAAAAGIVACVIQNRPAFTPSAITPNFMKLNPAAGLKNMFGPHGAMELVKTLFKVSVVGVVGFLVIWPELDTLMRLDRMDAGEMAAYTGGLVSRLVFSIIAILVPMAAADLVFQKRRHMKTLKMSKQDVKDEARQSDVAPEIKAAIKRRARELGRQRMMGDVPSADVIVTNPTHFAVALRYGKDAAAPTVVAKGADLLAQRIRELAAEHDVMIVENPPLARALYRQVEVGQEIPGEFFGAVAEVLAFVFRTSRRSLSWA
jgi:flagellar biosynthesis protein FlhB